MSENRRNVKVRINWVGITWVVLFILSVVFFFIATGFIAFPPKYALPLGIILAIIDLIMAVFSLRKKYRIVHNKKVRAKKPFVTLINCILCVVLAGGSIYVPILEARLKGIFVEPSETQEIKINAYVMTSEYKAAHTDKFASTDTSSDISDYISKKFITQKIVDQQSQEEALNKLMRQFEVDSLDVISENSFVDSVSALYNGTGDVMLMNETFENTISELPGRENFTKDTQILYTITVETTMQKKLNESDLTKKPFTIFVAGSDSRDTELEYYTRTDTDLLVTVDPVNKQVLLISVPRDWYVPNPALGNGKDKLTHLGNNGLENSMAGLNEEFEFDYIKNYFEVNFVSFSNIVDAIGGVDIYNPYEFSLDNGACVYGTPGEYGEASGYVFEEGNLHLNGSKALSYVRERYNLPTGDLGRNEHQAIVIQAIIKKLSSHDVISKVNSLINKLQGNFLSSISADDFYDLAQMQLNDGGDWNFVTYHLSGTDGNDVTASTGSEVLYVSYPIPDQVEFVRNEITKVMSGEIITQDTMPGDTSSTAGTTN
jgi:LCP family protein required for cell wall assembly